jgi:hypothetical protein
MGPESTSGRESFKYDRFHRSTGMWLLDFNQCHQCQKFAEGAEGVLQLQKAFYFNDPYYPQPISDDPRDLGCGKPSRVPTRMQVSVSRTAICPDNSSMLLSEKGNDGRW